MCCCSANNDSLPEDFVVYGPQFSSNNEYKNPFLKGRFRLKLRGFESLIRKTEWNYLDEGGFKILIPSFNVTNDVVITGEFY